MTPTEEFINTKGPYQALHDIPRENGDLSVEFNLCYSGDIGKKFDIIDEYARVEQLNSEWPT